MVAHGLILMDNDAIMEFGTPEHFCKNPALKKTFFEPDTLGLQIIL